MLRGWVWQWKYFLFSFYVYFLRRNCLFLPYENDRTSRFWSKNILSVVVLLSCYFNMVEVHRCFFFFLENRFGPKKKWGKNREEPQSSCKLCNTLLVSVLPHILRLFPSLLSSLKICKMFLIRSWQYENSYFNKFEHSYKLWNALHFLQTCRFLPSTSTIFI